QDQHARNLPAAVVAARSGRFAGVTHLLDVGGGTGVFEIPLAAEYPRMRFTIAEWPPAIENIRAFLMQHEVGDRVALVSADVTVRPWTSEPCDGVLFGNFLHAFDDDTCAGMLEETRAQLSPGGRVFIHELLWNETRDGPMYTALTNFAMRTLSPGRQ